MATTEVLLPLMGEGVNEANISGWLVAEGEKVKKDAPLLEVSTDKVDTEIPAPADGILIAIKANEGDTVVVDQVLAIIADSASEVDTASSSSPEVKNSVAPEQPAARTEVSTAAATSNPSTVRSSPLVRKIAAENKVNLEQVAGSGLHGRITKKDILSFIDGDQESRAITTSPTTNSAETETAPTSRQDSPVETGLATTKDDDGTEYLEGVAVDRQPMSRMRQLIAKHMVDSVRTSPHVTTTFEVDMHQVVAMREEFKDEFFQTEGFKLTFTPFLLYAATQAIKKFPIVNTSLDGNDILYKKDINLGCAVALDNGLIVPVIKRAGELSLLGIARRLNDLVVRARAKKLKPDEVQGGTFSVTNPGGYGSLTSNPIINQPQVAILGIGSIVKRPVVFNDMIAIRPQMLVSLTFDHRVIDGEGGAKYLACLRDELEGFEAKPI